MRARILTFARANVVLILLLALVTAGGITAALLPWDSTPTPPPRTVTLGGPTHATVTLGQPAQQQLEHAEQTGVDDHAGLRDESPAGVSPAELAAGRAQQQRLAESNPLPNVSPLAAPEQHGCTDRFVRNYSSRNGVRPRLFVLHYTVSPNIAGWADVNAIVSYFDQAASQVSSNYVVDNEGHCAYIVAETSKAWAQAGFNSTAISVEVINTGSEPTYAGTAGLHRLGQLVSDATRRWGIPLRRGAVSGCTVTAAGVVDHAQLGACGGGHTDIGHYSVQAVISAAIAARHASQSVSPPLTRVETRINRGIIRPRSQGAHSRKYWCARNSAQRVRIRKLARAQRGGWDRQHRGARYQRLGHRYMASCR